MSDTDDTLTVGRIVDLGPGKRNQPRASGKVVNIGDAALKEVLGKLTVWSVEYVDAVPIHLIKELRKDISDYLDDPHHTVSENIKRSFIGQQLAGDRYEK